MIIHTYDLHGKKRFCQYSSKEEAKQETELEYSINLRELLIYPKKSSNTNRTPYLQDPTFPSIEDFIDDPSQINLEILIKGEAESWDIFSSFDDEYEDELNNESCITTVGNTSPSGLQFKRGHFLGEVLWDFSQDSKFDKNRKLINDYFSYQTGLVKENDLISEPDSIILTVPDNYDPATQEILLRNCHLPRSKTLLLWRSVAICLAHMDRLIHLGVTEGDKVAIIDITDRNILCSILTLNTDEGVLVPQRSVYREDKNYHNKLLKAKDNLVLSEEDRLLLYTSGIKKGKHEKVPLNLSNSLLSDVGYCIVCGDTNLYKISSPHIPDERILQETDSNGINSGAALFAYRNFKGLPTYLDECEALSIVITKPTLQKVEAQQLIPASTRCKGGKRIKGKVNKETSLAKDNENIQLLLLLGQVTNDAPLKELIKKLGTKTTERQTVKLEPSMIPGQGIAEVLVHLPILKEPIHLDFLEMKSTDLTISSLQEAIPLSYPIDFPDIEADSKIEVSDEISSYLNFNCLPDGDLFAKARYRSQTPDGHDKIQGLERFSRTNVFGTGKKKNLPTCINKETALQLMKKLSLDYFRSKQRKDNDTMETVIRLAAWTYQSDNEHINQIAEDVFLSLKKLEPVRKQYYTMCAFCLSSNKKRQDLIHSFLRLSSYRRSKIPPTSVTGRDNWIYMFARMFTNNNDLFDSLDTSTSRELMHELSFIFFAYTNPRNTKNIQYLNDLIISIMFLLRKRKTDPNFLSKESTNPVDQVLRGYLAKAIERIDTNIVTQIDEGRSVKDYLKYKTYASSRQETLVKMSGNLWEFVANKGSLDGIPQS